MKRYINMPLRKALPLLFICAILLIGTTGCTTTTNKTTSGINVVIDSKNESAAIGSGYLASTPTPGNKFVLYNVTVTNVNEKDALLSPDYFKLKTTDATIYDYDYNTYSSSLKGLDSVSNTQPGEKVTGTVVFQIPQSAQPSVLTYEDYYNKMTINL